MVVFRGDGGQGKDEEGKGDQTLGDRGDQTSGVEYTIEYTDVL